MAAGLSPVEPRTDSIGEALAEWGKVALIETVGRVSGSPVRTAVGFVDEPDSELIVAAGSDVADWVLNLRAAATCRATIGDRVATYAAHEVAGAERAQAIARLILKYGTPAEGLGRGPVFRLVPLASRNDGE